MSNSRSIEKIASSIGAASMITGALVLLLVAGHFFLGFVSWTRGLLQPPKVDIIEQQRSARVFDGYLDKDEFFAEEAWLRNLTVHFEPYYHWRGKEIKSKYTNVGADGVRRTVHGEVRPDAKKVFVLGGSTTWGAIVPDQYTIPSYLQARLGGDFRVYNYGEKGWVSTQALNYLLQQLALGNVPDYVVFYDGANDGYVGAYSPAIPRDPHYLRVRDMNDRRHAGWTKLLVDAFDRTNYKLVLDYVARKTGSDPHKRREAGVEGKVETNARAVADLYDAHIRQVRALAAEYRFKVLFFWQPNLCASNRRDIPYEREFINRMSPLWVRSQQLVYQHAKAAFSGRERDAVFFLGDIFEDVKEPIYIDWAHLGPRGNEIIANEIARRVMAVRLDVIPNR